MCFFLNRNTQNSTSWKTSGQGYQIRRHLSRETNKGYGKGLGTGPRTSKIQFCWKTTWTQGKLDETPTGRNYV